jgi:hypothetical protein
MQSRRDLLKAVSTGLTGAALATGAGLSPATVRASSLRAFATMGGGEAPWCLVSPLTMGSNVGKGWRIQNLSALEAGASILTLQHPTRGTARVHLCARRGGGHGLTHTQLLDLILMDGGTGELRTQEGLARVVTGIGKRIAKNELGAVDEETIDAMSRMLTHKERMAIFGPENLL